TLPLPTSLVSPYTTLFRSLRIDRALRGRGQPGDRAHERGFAGAVGADDADGLVAVGDEAHALECVDLLDAALPLEHAAAPAELELLARGQGLVADVDAIADDAGFVGGGRLGGGGFDRVFVIHRDRTFPRPARRR